MRHSHKENNLRGCAFVITRKGLLELLERNPENPFHADFMNTFFPFSGGSVYLYGSLYEKMVAEIGDNKELLVSLQGVFLNGGDVTGSASFGDECNDVVFLVAALEVIGSKDKIIILTGKDESFSFNKHDDFDEKMKELGISKLRVPVFNIRNMVEYIRLNDVEFVSEVESLFGGPNYEY